LANLKPVKSKKSEIGRQIPHDLTYVGSKKAKLMEAECRKVTARGWKGVNWGDGGQRM
jgi:hypothetical protein